MDHEHHNLFFANSEAIAKGLVEQPIWFSFFIVRTVYHKDIGLFTVLPSMVCTHCPNEHRKVNVRCFTLHYTRLQAMEDAKMEKSDIQEIVLVGGSTQIPMVQRMISDYFGGKQPNMGDHPEEAVAHGAALQAAILSSDAYDEDTVRD